MQYKCISLISLSIYNYHNYIFTWFQLILIYIRVLYIYICITKNLVDRESSIHRAKTGNRASTCYFRNSKGGKKKNVELALYPEWNADVQLEVFFFLVSTSLFFPSSRRVKSSQITLSQFRQFSQSKSSYDCINVTIKKFICIKICKLARILSTLSIIDVNQRAVAFLYFFLGLSHDRYFSRITDVRKK